jgi:hypothetical protein
MVASHDEARRRARAVTRQLAIALALVGLGFLIVGVLVGATFV